VHQKSLPALYEALSELGLTKSGVHTARDVVACPGAESCNLAVTSSRALGAAITERSRKTMRASSPPRSTRPSRSAGGPNSCGQHHVADIGFHGGAKTFGGLTVPVYQLHLGGGVDERGARFGSRWSRSSRGACRTPCALDEALRNRPQRERAPEAVLPARRSQASHRHAGEPRGAAGGPGARSDRHRRDPGFVIDTKEGECAA